MVSPTVQAVVAGPLFGLYHGYEKRVIAPASIHATDPGSPGGKPGACALEDGAFEMFG